MARLLRTEQWDPIHRGLYSHLCGCSSAHDGKGVTTEMMQFFLNRETLPGTCQVYHLTLRQVGTRLSEMEGVLGQSKGWLGFASGQEPLGLGTDDALWWVD